MLVQLARPVLLGTLGLLQAQPPEQPRETLRPNAPAAQAQGLFDRVATPYDRLFIVPAPRRGLPEDAPVPARETKGRLRCGIMIIPADPSIDPKMIVRVPVNLDPKMAIQVPPCPEDKR